MYRQMTPSAPIKGYEFNVRQTLSGEIVRFKCVLRDAQFDRLIVVVDIVVRPSAP